MKIGVSQIVLKGYSSDRVLQLSQEAGYNVAELVFAEAGDPEVNLSDGELRALSQRFKDAGVTITSVLTRYAKPTRMLSPDKEVRADAVKATIRAIEIAAVTEAGAILLHPGHNSAEITYQQAWDFLQECLAQVAPVAAEYQVHVGIENVWNRILLSPKEMREFIDAVGSEWIGCYLDTGNMMHYGFTEQWIIELGSRIKRVHFKDYDRRERQFVPLMEGDSDWPRIVSLLEEIGYDQGFIHEVEGDWDFQIEMANRMRAICNKEPLTEAK